LKKYNNHIEMKKILLFTIIVGFSSMLKAQQTPAKDQSKSMLFTHAMIHVGNGEVIQDGAIGFDQGKISYVGSTSNAPATFDETVDYNNHHIYPGIITPNSTLGLVEISAVRASNDQSEVGIFNPNVRSLIAYNTESNITTTVRTNGVLIGQICPRGGFISGSSSVVQFDAWNWEDAVIKEEDGIHLHWPTMHSRWQAKDDPTEKSKQYDSQVLEIASFFETAYAYFNGTSKKRDLKMEAMKGVFSGKKQLFIHAEVLKELEAVLDFVDQFHINKPVLVGGYDAHLIADALIEKQIPVILRRVHDLPMYEDDDTDLPYKLPAMLAEKGILFCLQNAGDMEQMGTRNLPFYAGTAAAYGMNKEDALSTITLNTAKILGIDDVLGSLEIGKRATLFVSTGDALDMRTNNVIKAFIDGRDISLNNHQKVLYERYKNKYE
jgi:imidazolonepropionase-like amidohydrolase